MAAGGAGAAAGDADTSHRGAADRIRRRLAISAWIGAFLQALGLLGWIIGRNVRIDIRWAGANADASAATLRNWSALAPDVILAHGNAAVGALLQVTRTVPIVFPVFSRSGRRRLCRQLGAAGRQRHRLLQFEYSLSGKWPEMLKQIAPGVTRAAVLRDPH